VSAVAHLLLYQVCKQICTWTAQGNTGNQAHKVSSELNNPLNANLVTKTYGLLSEEEKAEWVSRIVSNVHAIFASLGAFRWILNDWQTIQTDFDFAFGGSEIRHFYMMCTAGYLFYDLMLCLKYLRSFGEITTLIHHIVILIAYSLGLHYHFGTFYMGFFLINEVSTPFLNIRWFLFKMGLTDTKYYEWNGYQLAISFFIFRVVLNLIAVEHMTRGFYRFYAVLISREGLPTAVLFFLPVLAWVHVSINLYWFWLIISKVWRKLRGEKELEKVKTKKKGLKKERDLKYRVCVCSEKL